ncbi:MAG: pyridoxamine 5'-phosphate oxidase family protein [Patescibacteria group bacterium]
MNDQAKKDALDFLMNEKVGVLATVAEGNPHAAFIYYICDEYFNIYFTTVVNTKKHQNIASGSKVAFTVGKTKPPQTVQIEGSAEIVSDENTINALAALYIDIATENTHYPVPLTKLDWEKGVVMYKITPTRLKWSDFTDSKKKEEKGVSVVIIG